MCAVAAVVYVSRRGVCALVIHDHGFEIDLLILHGLDKIYLILSMDWRACSRDFTAALSWRPCGDDGVVATRCGGDEQRPRNDGGAE